MIKSFKYILLSMLIFSAAYSGNLIIDDLEHLSPDTINKLLGVDIEICDILISSKAEKIIGNIKLGSCRHFATRVTAFKNLQTIHSLFKFLFAG